VDFSTALIGTLRRKLTVSRMWCQTMTIQTG
jgi:hypothetical protein